MTVRPQQPAAPEESPQRAPRPARPLRRAVLPVLLLALLTLLLLTLPTLAGQSLLRLINSSALSVSADRVSGPLWAPRLSGATLRAPGVSAQVSEAQLGLAGFDPRTRTARINVWARGAEVDLDLKALSAQRRGGHGLVQLLPGRLDLERVRLRVDGRAAQLPDGRWTVRSVPQQAGQQGLLVLGATTRGTVNLLARYRVKGEDLSGSANLRADASVLNTFWHGTPAEKEVGAVTGGTLRAAYRFGGERGLRGDFTLTDGSLTVPGARFVRVADIAGGGTQRGDLFSLALRGRGLGGPLTLSGTADLRAERWDVRAVGRPQMGALARSLGQAGDGTAYLTAHAYGWETAHVDASLRGPAGQFSALPYRDLRADYLFDTGTGVKRAGGHRADERSVLAFGADTRLQGRQRLSGRWAFQRSGTLAWTGELLGQPLGLTGTVSAADVLRAGGRALGGPISLSLGLRDRALQLAASPDFSGLKGDLAANGTVEHLRLALRGGQAGPLRLQGTGSYTAAGLNADLGPLQLDLDRQLRGGWTLDDLSVSGARLSGRGRLSVPDSRLSGTLSADVPLVDGVPSGPVSLNWRDRTADWTFAGGALTWRGDTFGLQAAGLGVSGYRLNGALSVTSALQSSFKTGALQAAGTLTATRPGSTLSARGLGDALVLSARRGGVTLDALTRLRPGFPTSAQLRGADVSGSLSTTGDGVSFGLRTGQQRASGRLDQQRWTASGAVDLGALRPLLGGNLAGRLQLAFTPAGGSARLDASGFGLSAAGTVTRSGSTLKGSTLSTGGLTLSSALAGEQARALLAGQLFPRLQLAGPISYRDQRLQLSVSGPYGALSASVQGQTRPITAGGVTLPGQALSLTGTLTPDRSARGTFGGLNLDYGPGGLRVTGQQPFSVSGETGQLTVNALVKTGAGGLGGLSGSVTASGTAGPYRFGVNGPLSALQARLSGPGGLRVSGSVDAPRQRYDLSVRGPLAGVYVQGRVSGQGANPTGTLLASDGAGGTARVQLRGLRNFSVRSSGLSVAGQTLRGDLSAAGGLLSGSARLGQDLTLTADRGQISVAGELAGTRLRASGRLALPAALTDLQVSAEGPFLSARASGDGNDLRGSLTLKPQRSDLSGAAVSLPRQTFPISASLTPLRVDIGGLSYAGGRWDGSAGVRYGLGGAAGRLALLGDGARLLARPAGGPLSGQVQLLPRLGGTLALDLSPLRPALPQALRPVTLPGQLRAALSPTGADLTLRGARYLGQPLNLSGRASWAGGLSADVLLTRPGSRLPLSYRGGTLNIRGAVLDAAALRPYLPQLTGGTVRADLTLPGPPPGPSRGPGNGPDLNRAQGRLTLDLRGASGEAAGGTLSLGGGRLGADLTSSLGGQQLRLSGPLYPQADARLSVTAPGTALQARLSGDLQTGAQLNASGTVGGRPLQLSAEGNLERGATLRGDVAGLSLILDAARPAGVSGSGGARSAEHWTLKDWALSGSFSAPDLAALTGSAGRLSGSVSGPLSDLRLSAVGRLAGGAFSLPARYRGGVLSVQAATASWPGAALNVSGALYPQLSLGGRATLSDYLPGRYTLGGRGTLSAPRLTLQGATGGGPRGLDAPGSTVTARLDGRAWSVSASGGQLAGGARGQLGAAGSGPGGLTSARFTVNAPYRAGGGSVQLSGASGWDARAGWLGALDLSGELAGQPLAGQLRGHGGLNAELTLGPGRVVAALPADLPRRPGGSVALTRLDLGALWARPDVLALNGTAQLAGADWSRPDLSFAGALTDAAGDLSGRLTAGYGPQGARLSLGGGRVTAAAQLSGGQLSASFSSAGAQLARLLPPAAGVTSLRLAGAGELSATVSGAPTLTRLTLSGLELSGSQRDAGPFSLAGNAEYTPQAGALSAQLSGALLGGTLRVGGALPSGLAVQLTDLHGQELGRLGLDALSGTARLSGAAADPLLGGTLTLARPELTAAIGLGGRLRDPQLTALGTLRGRASGQLRADLRDITLSPPGARVSLSGRAALPVRGQPPTTLSLDLSGVWPRLAGRAQLRAAALPEPVTLLGDGSGLYTLDAGTLGGGQVTLSPSGAGLIPQLAGRLTLTPLPLLGAGGDARLTLSASGPADAPALLLSGTADRLEHSGVSLRDLALSASLQGYDLGTLRAALTQAGQQAATLQGGTLRDSAGQDREGQTGATLHLVVSGLRAKLGGLTASVSGEATGGTRAGPTASASLRLDGGADGPQGSARAQYSGGSFALSGDAAAAGFAARLSGYGSVRAGWSGLLSVSGGPAGLLTRDARLSLSGPAGRPQLDGTLGLLGARGHLNAGVSGVQLDLTDGARTRAGGSLRLRLDEGAGGQTAWSGRVTLARQRTPLQTPLQAQAQTQAQTRATPSAAGGDTVPGVPDPAAQNLAALELTLSGPLTRPQAQLRLQSGTWVLSGPVSARRALLEVTDGQRQGQLSYDGARLDLNLPGLDLARLDVSGLGLPGLAGGLAGDLGGGDLQGRLSASGSLDAGLRDGSLRFSLQGARAPLTIPLLERPLRGDLAGVLTARGGELTAAASLQAPFGSVTVQGAHPTGPGGSYSGQLRARLAGEGGGTLSADAALDDRGLSGQVSAAAFPLTLGGVRETVDGTLRLGGQTFTLDAGATADVGAAAGSLAAGRASAGSQQARVTVSGQGGLLDALPLLGTLRTGAGQDARPLFGATEDGYSLRASLSNLELSGLKVAPFLSGRVSGEASLQNGGGTFVIRSPALRAGGTVLAARVEGTLVGGDWRLRGSLGNTDAATSQLVGSLSGGVVSGLVQLRGLPVDALLGAFSGPLPGRGTLTGVTRFRFPLSDPASGEASLVAERLSVSSTRRAADSGAPGLQQNTQTPIPRTPATQPVTPQSITPQSVTQTLVGAGSAEYADGELRSIDLHLRGAGAWDVTGRYTRAQVDLTARFQDTTFTPVLSLIPGIRDQDPALQGTVTLQLAGSYDRPRAVLGASDLRGALGGVSLEVPTLQGQLQGSGDFSASARVKAGGVLGADGTLGLRGRLADRTISGTQVTYSGLIVPQGLGRLENVTGLLIQSGTLALAGGNLPATSSPVSDARFDVRLQSLGGAGVGSLSVTGSVSPTIDLTLSARNYNLPISAIYGQESRVSADLRATEQTDTDSSERVAGRSPIVVSGAVDVARLVLGRPGSAAVIPAPGQAGVGGNSGTDSYVSPFPEALQTLRSQQQAAARAPSPLLSRVQFANIPIRAPGAIRVDETLARAELSGDLTLSGSGDQPRLLGEVRVLRGSIDLRDNEFTLASGGGTFSGATFDGTSVYPSLSAVASGTVPLADGGGSVGVRLGVSGRFQRDSGLTLETALTCTSGCSGNGHDYTASNPAAEAQLYALLALGTSDLSRVPGNLTSLGTSAVHTALNVFVLGQFQRSVAGALGLDVFRLDPSLPGENGNTAFGARVTLGSYLTRELYLQYQVNLAGDGTLAATYTTPDNRFTFKASTPLSGVDLGSLRPSFSVAYNLSAQSSLLLGLQSPYTSTVSGVTTTRGAQFGVNYVYRW